MSANQNISSNNYVDITSGVGGGGGISGRSLSCRVISTTELIPTGAILAFSDSPSVSDYFGPTSDEYARAAYYFGYLSKQISKPKKIEFARWASSDTSAQAFGTKAGTLAELQVFTSDTLTLTLAGVDGVITPDLSAASSYADVANTLQTGIQGLGGGFASATVVFDANKTSFNFDTNGVADGALTVTASSTGLLDALGWRNLITSDGVGAQSVTDQLAAMINISNDFGSFVYSDALTLPQIKDAAIFTNEQNVSFQFHAPLTIADAQSYYDELKGYGGVGLTINETAGEFAEMLPCAQLASQDFLQSGASTNYMFLKDDRLTPGVTTDSDYKTLNALKVNFMGRTQESGVQLSFYQSGVLLGPDTSPLQMGVFANEQWFKSYVKAQFLNTLTEISIWPADNTGNAIGNTVLQNGVDRALASGIIAIGKNLSDGQKNFINVISGESGAISAVETRGFWYKGEIIKEVDDGIAKNIYSYIIIYATSEGVSKVIGKHNLI